MRKSPGSVKLETAAFAKLGALVLQVMEGRAAELRNAGVPADKVEEALSREMPDLNNWLAARKADIRSIISSAAGGGTPVLADGTPAVEKKIERKVRN